MTFDSKTVLFLVYFEFNVCFNQIFHYFSHQKLPIVKNIVPEIESVPEDVTYCEICGRCDREDRLLLCDGCDFGYHCECLSPPLETIPIEEWFCPDCYHRLFGPDTYNSHSHGWCRPFGSTAAKSHR